MKKQETIFSNCTAIQALWLDSAMEDIKFVNTTRLFKGMKKIKLSFYDMER
jgi:hypothetical protein